MSIPLLLSLFLFSAGSSGPATTPAAPGDSAAVTTPLASESPYDFDRIQIDSSPSTDDFCLNIHAFVFKTDDDRVPKLVRETTCMPASRARAKKVDKTVQPKLIPATGGNSF